MMKRTHCLALLFASITLSSCGPKKPSNVWVNHTEDSSGLVVEYAVSGTSTGQPQIGVLCRYVRGDASQPKFEWESKDTVVGSPEFRVNGKNVDYRGTFILFVNDSRGMPQSITVSAEDAGKLFGEKSHPSREDLLKFWDEVVQPQIPK